MTHRLPLLVGTLLIGCSLAHGRVDGDITPEPPMAPNPPGAIPPPPPRAPLEPGVLLPGSYLLQFPEHAHLSAAGGPIRVDVGTQGGRASLTVLLPWERGVAYAARGDEDEARPDQVTFQPELCTSCYPAMWSVEDGATEVWLYRLEGFRVEDDQIVIADALGALVSGEEAGASRRIPIALVPDDDAPRTRFVGPRGAQLFPWDAIDFGAHEPVESDAPILWLNGVRVPADRLERGIIGPESLGAELRSLAWWSLGRPLNAVYEGGDADRSGNLALASRRDFLVVEDPPVQRVDDDLYFLDLSPVGYAVETHLLTMESNGDALGAFGRLDVQTFGRSIGADIRVCGTSTDRVHVWPTWSLWGGPPMNLSSPTLAVEPVDADGVCRGETRRITVAVNANGQIVTGDIAVGLDVRMDADEPPRPGTQLVVERFVTLD